MKPHDFPHDPSVWERLHPQFRQASGCVWLPADPADLDDATVQQVLGVVSMSALRDICSATVTARQVAVLEKSA